MWYQQFCGCGATSISDGIILIHTTPPHRDYKNGDDDSASEDGNADDDSDDRDADDA